MFRRLPSLTVVSVISFVAMALTGAPACRRTITSKSSGFPALVDDYLEQFSLRHPSIAAGNGLHAHDGDLEDLSAGAISAEVDWLRGVRRQLDATDSAALTADEQVDRRILVGIVDGWLLDLTVVNTWSRNPMIYASAISDGVHNLMTMESSAADSRARLAVAKLQHVPRLLSSARENILNPPKVFVERSLLMFRGISDMLSRDLLLAFADLADPALRNELTSAAASARSAVDAYAADLEQRVLPSATGSFAVGLANVEARYRAEELIDTPAAALLAIGERELAAKRAEFSAAAARVDFNAAAARVDFNATAAPASAAPGRSPVEIWRTVLADHPKRGELASAAQKTVDDLMTFIRERRLVDVPTDERVVVAAAPVFDLGLASMHSSPPLEAHPVKSFYYVTDARAEWPAERQDAWLQKFNYPTLADITAHEVAPGHFVHSLFMRRTPGKIRRIWIGLNPFPQPSSGQDGWAHYAEQLVIDEGFKKDDPRYRLAQTSEALTRICRMIVGLRLHSGEWTVDRAAAFFEQEAHLPEPAARQEATRGTYDPTYGGYFLGKMAVMKLRRDYEAAKGDRFNLREFHERVMTNGIAPWWAHRQLLLPGDTRAVIE
jgi:uncharacterized protein (DUF885 family)